MVGLDIQVDRPRLLLSNNDVRIRLLVARELGLRGFLEMLQAVLQGQAEVLPCVGLTGRTRRGLVNLDLDRGHLIVSWSRAPLAEARVDVHLVLGILSVAFPGRVLVADLAFVEAALASSLLLSLLCLLLGGPCALLLVPRLGLLLQVGLQAVREVLREGVARVGHVDTIGIPFCFIGGVEDRGLKASILMHLHILALDRVPDLRSVGFGDNRVAARAGKLEEGLVPKLVLSRELAQLVLSSLGRLCTARHRHDPQHVREVYPVAIEDVHHSGVGDADGGRALWVEAQDRVDLRCVEVHASNNIIPVVRQEQDRPHVDQAPRR
mmetsp:Transcript_95490/g.204917  ORF Transcript_95490/g.204917 Transcript_95490/m.204917 type:complete len:323 (+) Transcript_95490:2537-3505(+)